MIDIPMNTKPPRRLAEAGAEANTKIQKPRMLREIPQSTGRKTQPAPPQPPVNRAPQEPPHPPVNRAPQASTQPPVNRAPQASTHPPVNRVQAAPQPILAGVRPGAEMRKGQKASLMQKNPNLERIAVCMGWRVKNPMCDLDASAFLLKADNRVPGEDWFVFYGQTESPDGSVLHRGGNSPGDAAVLEINLKKVSPYVKKIVFIITINEALQNRLNFGMVSDAYIRVVDRATNAEIVRYVLDEYYSNVTSMVVGELYEKNSEWKFNAVGNGVARDLAGLCELYGVQASY